MKTHLSLIGINIALPVDDHLGAVPVIGNRVDPSSERAWARPIPKQCIDRPFSHEPAAQRDDFRQLQSAPSRGGDLLGVRKRAAIRRIEDKFGKQCTDTAGDPQGSALDWSQQRAREGLPRLFGVIGLARDTLHQEAPELARDARHLIIDGPPRIAGLMRSALLTADLVLIPAQPSPFDGWASGEMLKLIDEARIFRPRLLARFVLNRCAARTVIARATAELLVDHDPPVLGSTIGRRVGFADAARNGRLVGEIDDDGPAAREIASLTAEIESLMR